MEKEKKESGNVNRKISISEVQTNSENPSMPTAGPTLVTCTSEICKKQLKNHYLVAKVSNHLSNQGGYCTSRIGL